MACISPITINVRIRDQGETTAEVLPVWVGRSVAVHAPFRADGADPGRGLWTLTHITTGMAVVTALPISKRNAVALAKSWDGRLALITCASDAATWQHRAEWSDTIARIRCPWQAGTIAKPDNEWTSLSLAIGRRLSVRAGDRPAIRWRGEWRDAPTDQDLNRWTMDSVCESPDGRTVEPDAPDSWLRILGLV